MKPYFIFLIAMEGASLGVQVANRNYSAILAQVVALLATWRWGEYASKYGQL